MKDIIKSSAMIYGFMVGLCLFIGMLALTKQTTNAQFYTYVGDTLLWPLVTVKWIGVCLYYGVKSLCSM